MYEVFDHTADLGLRIRAESLPSLFAEAGRALLSVVLVDPDSVETVERLPIKVAGKEPDFLLVDWLTELLFAFESSKLLLREFDIVIDEAGLIATAGGETYDPQRHALEHEVKAITYHGLKVVEDGDGWVAEVILDI